jgi:hypothetical protein
MILLKKKKTLNNLVTRYQRKKVCIVGVEKGVSLSASLGYEPAQKNNRIKLFKFCVHQLKFNYINKRIKMAKRQNWYFMSFLNYVCYLTRSKT